MSSNLIPLKQKAIILRRKGYSYGYIKKTLGLKSKGTLSVWLRDVQLDESSKKLLMKNNNLAIKRGLLAFNLNRTKRIKTENDRSFRDGFKLIPKNINKRDLMIIGIALYWGEGTKSWSKNSYSRFSFSNSDPKMVAVCMRFLREILNISESKIMCGIHLYQNTNAVLAKDFWSNVTNLDKKSFYVTEQVSRASDGVRKAVLPYGTFHIRVNNRLVYHKTMGMLGGLISRLN